MTSETDAFSVAGGRWTTTQHAYGCHSTLLLNAMSVAWFPYDTLRCWSVNRAEIEYQLDNLGCEICSQASICQRPVLGALGGGKVLQLSFVHTL